jgi:hypothetical protein
VESIFGGSTPNTRLDYALQADVANGFALITGVSAAAEDLLLAAAGTTNELGTSFRTSDFHVNWCWFYDVTAQPEEITVELGSGARRWGAPARCT